MQAKRTEVPRTTLLAALRSDTVLLETTTLSKGELRHLTVLGV